MWVMISYTELDELWGQVSKALANRAFYITENERQSWTKRAVPKCIPCGTRKTPDTALAIDIHPQADQRMRVGVFSPRAAFHGRNLRMIKTQVEPADQLPDRAGAVLVVDQTIHIHCAQKKLRSVDRNQAGRRCRRAHTRGVPAHRNSARINLGTISSQLPVPKFPKFLARIRSDHLSGVTNT